MGNGNNRIFWIPATCVLQRRLSLLESEAVLPITGGEVAEVVKNFMVTGLQGLFRSTLSTSMLWMIDMSGILVHHYTSDKFFCFSVCLLEHPLLPPPVASFFLTSVTCPPHTLPQPLMPPYVLQLLVAFSIIEEPCERMVFTEPCVKRGQGRSIFL